MSDTVPYGYKERRREAHTQAEQKRRDAIKKGYEDLQYLVPTCQQQDSISSYKLSKATILQRSIEYIQSMQKTQLKIENGQKALQKEVAALQIMRSNYEQMLKKQREANLHHQQQQAIIATENDTNDNLNQSISEHVKFEVFKSICDQLFTSFDRYVSFEDFDQLTASIFNWLEEYCCPQALRDTCLTVLRDFYSSGIQ